jgi:hypothetical protein
MKSIKSKYRGWLKEIQELNLIGQNISMVKGQVRERAGKIWGSRET